MNKDTARGYLPLVQALADGKTIQWRSSTGEWLDLEHVSLGDLPERYRVKPEPRTVYVLTLPRTGLIQHAFWTEERAQVMADTYGYVLTEFKEVLNEQQVG